MRSLLLALLLIMGVSATGQDKPYYYNIPDTPVVYTPETVAARLVDGLGFRYFWATEGLTEKDLSYKPTDSSRTSRETIEHIFGLTTVLNNAVHKKASGGGTDPSKLSFDELRKSTLKNIREASEILKGKNAKLEDFDMVFKGANGSTTRYPFWNLINGPVSDALWHVGQVVSFRRSSGNPLPDGVSVLQGKKFD